MHHVFVLSPLPNLTTGGWSEAHQTPRAQARPCRYHAQQRWRGNLLPTAQ